MSFEALTEYRTGTQQETDVIRFRWKSRAKRLDELMELQENKIKILLDWSCHQAAKHYTRPQSIKSLAPQTKLDKRLLSSQLPSLRLAGASSV